ncbi:MAG: cytochrome C, partial [Gammaproteobacteria bacterium]|nr:cytochrome C [Gammaproteobacteria bacterium]
GINGEGRVTPLMPGCQVISTVIGKDGSVLAKNEIWNTPEGKGVDHSPVQPHTAGRRARTCESCHSNPKALGYGIENGRFMRGYENDLVVDLQDAKGRLIPGKTSVQSPAIPKLDHDLSQIVTPDGRQLVSVGSHWPLGGPLPQEMREKMERTGLCMGCHQKQADEEFWKKVAESGWRTNEAHQELMGKAIDAYAERQGTGESQPKAAAAK